MKTRFLLLFISATFIFSDTICAQGILGKIKSKVKQRSDAKIDNAIDKGLDNAEQGAKPSAPADNSAGNDNSNTATNNSTGTENTGNNAAPAPPVVLKTYQNYDFVPGDKVLFEDNFLDDQDGEFPADWELTAGQAVMNKINDEPAFKLTEGNYARVNPRMKTETYLTDPFTIEYDMYYVPGSYGIMTMLESKDNEGNKKESSVQVSSSEVVYSGENSFSKSLPGDIQGENFDNKWHHVAIAYKNKQLKVYVDQYRILVVPDTKQVYESIQFAGIGDEEKPIVFRNVRIASGGNMNMIGKKFTESKIVTHGINFDVDKATIKPESMGTMNMILQVMKDNPGVKFEVDGHSDNSGTSQHNLTLSQQRAEAVKNQLISMGVDASRLTAKGFGDSKPISDNTSPEGKANNRRVEFVKM